MSLPTKDQLSTAIENPRNILDPDLDGYSAMDGLVGPESYSGGFCIVYPVTNGSKKYAFRLWHTEIEGIKDRLKKISTYLSSANISYFVEFEYVDAALRVPGYNGAAQAVDAVRMEWINGQNLVEYINSIVTDTNLTNQEKKRKLYKLADNFLQMVSCLHENKVSHGDLQHGNIIILDSGEIKLVDYDSVYVPLFTDEVQVTSGLSTYQHPNRKGTKRLASLEDDYFSELIIYLSILCIAEDFDLWTPIDIRNEHILLFSDNDYKDIESSPIYNTVKTFKNSKIKLLLRRLVEYLGTCDFDVFEPLEYLLKNTYTNQPESLTLDGDDVELTSTKRSNIRTKKGHVQIQVIDKDLAKQRYKNN